MGQQTKCIELPFNQLELAQLELFLNRELEENWVLVKVEGNKFYFEIRPGKLYCYQVRLLMEPIGGAPNFLTMQERQQKFVKQQEEGGWYFMGQLKGWHIFRSLVEKNPTISSRDWEGEYKKLKWSFLHNKIGNILAKGGILFLLIMSIILFSPLMIITSNYVLGIILTFIMIMILGGLEINTWLNFKYKMYKKLKNNIPFESNESLIRNATVRSRYIGGILGIALFIFVLGMLIDGMFARSLPIILMTFLIVGIFVQGYLEELGEMSWVKQDRRKRKIVYVTCLTGIIVTGIWNCIDNIEMSYQGKEALAVKERMQELSLVTLDDSSVLLDNSNSMAYIGNIEVIEREAKTIFLKHYVQYAEWQGEQYLSLHYYETWNSNWASKIFKFLLKANKVDEEHGYQKIKPQWYGADEAFIEEYGSKLYLRKGRYIIEIQSTSESLRHSNWQNKIRYKNKALGKVKE